MASAASLKSFPECFSSCPCLSMSSTSSLIIKGNAVSNFQKNVGKRMQLKMVDLSTSFLDSSAKMLSYIKSRNGCSRKRQRLIVVGELGGQYDDTFNDVKAELINYFTFKAVRTVLEQLYEMNPPQYKWFNNFCAENVPNNAKRFLQTLVKERRELAERVMITRLTLYGRWIKKCDHGEIYNEISDENLKLMRERLLETIQWPLDDTTKPDQTD
ncbi:hypothetical protein ACS0TY_003230 [Phlomoides rotata]